MDLIDLSCCTFSTEVAFMFQTSVETLPLIFSFGLSAGA